LVVGLIFLFFGGDGFDGFNFGGLISAGDWRKAATDFGGNDAPTIVFVLLHGVAKL
jgi:hypothetical protein